MNERMKELLHQAGFILWQDEDWNPGDMVDWSARYDDELHTLIQLIVHESADWIHEHVGAISEEDREDLLKHFT